MHLSENVRTMKRGHLLSLVVVLAGLTAMPGFAQQAAAQSAPPAGTPGMTPVKPAAKMIAIPNDPTDGNWASANNAYATAAALRAKGDKQGACNQIQAATTSLTKVKAAHSHSQDMLSKAKVRFCGA